MKIRLLPLLLLSIVTITACTSSQELTGTTSLLFPKDGNPRWELEFSVANRLLLSSGFTVYAGASEFATDQAYNMGQLKGKGIKSMAYISVDPQSPEIAAALGELRKEGIKVICYDRLQQNTPDVDLYITADSRKIGELQAAAFDPLPAGARIEIMSGAPNDRNARELFEGAWSKLAPNVDGGKQWIIPSGRKTFETTTMGSWNAMEASNYIASVLNQYYADGTMPDAILCPSDVAAQAVITVLQQRFNTNKLPIITGQDNSAKSRELIKDGLQTMTVDKNAVEYINSTVDAIFKFQNGGEVPTKATTNNGSVDVKTIVITPQAVYKSDINN